MKKILLICAAIFAGTMLFADEDHMHMQYDPKSEAKHLVVPMYLLSETGDTLIGEVVVVETKYGLAFFPI